MSWERRTHGKGRRFRLSAGRGSIGTRAIWNSRGSFLSSSDDWSRVCCHSEKQISAIVVVNEGGESEAQR